MDPIAEDSSIVKRKRTKRQRSLLSSPAPPALTSSSTSAEYSVITAEEEEDMANCLILLAQGAHKTEHSAEPNRRFAEAPTTAGGKVGFFVYECKTCSKCFPSFQALGGHRASHKKPKLLIPSASPDEQKEDSVQLSMNSFSLQVTAKARIHECSICGAEFSSGQALGGHMRRHRPVNVHEGAKIERNSNGISLDLNLPPPCDHEGDVKKSSSSVSPKKMPPFSFGSKTPIMVLASSLVNCHY